MTENQAMEMREELRKHYGCRVAPVDEYCDALDEYCNHAKDYIASRYPEVWSALPTLRMMISKSCFLDRLIYQGEKPRLAKCEIHQGHWSGIPTSESRCACSSCCTTGWLPSTS